MHDTKASPSLFLAQSFPSQEELRSDCSFSSEHRTAKNYRRTNKYTTEPAQRVAMPSLATADSSITVKGEIVGTFQYMAREQLEGKEADARTDILALGTVLYETATGKSAFTTRRKRAATVNSAKTPQSGCTRRGNFLRIRSRPWPFQGRDSVLEWQAISISAALRKPRSLVTALVSQCPRISVSLFQRLSAPTASLFRHSIPHCSAPPRSAVPSRPGNTLHRARCAVEHQPHSRKLG